VARQTGIVSPAYAVYRPLRHEVFRPQFIDLLLRTKPYVAEYVCRSTGIRSSRLRLYPEQFLRIPVLCPLLAEQQAILDAITDATAELEHAIQSAQREISLLREYRTRLIADVVTGKLDVRVAAASLPEETDDVGAVPCGCPDDDTGTLAEGEDITVGDLDAAPEEAEA